MRNLTFLLIALLSLTIVSCASPEAIDACVDTTSSKGFFFGLLHGFIAPVTFILSLFMDDVTMYAVNNSGWLYDLGFLLGIGGFSGGIFKSRGRRRRS